MPSVRPARPADAQAIARVYIETWRAAYAGLLPDQVLLDLSLERQAISWSRAIDAAGPGRSVLVAEDETAGVVGVSSCGRPYRGAPLTFEGEVFTLYVDPDHQERGLGRDLLDGLFGALRE
jgi:ribosomal protein S18 acetylase RimI-like enzyme